MPNYNFGRWNDVCRGIHRKLEWCMSWYAPEVGTMSVVLCIGSWNDVCRSMYRKLGRYMSWSIIHKQTQCFPLKSPNMFLSNMSKCVNHKKPTINALHGSCCFIINTVIMWLIYIYLIKLKAIKLQNWVFS